MRLRAAQAQLDIKSSQDMQEYIQWLQIYWFLTIVHPVQTGTKSRGANGLILLRPYLGVRTYLHPLCQSEQSSTWKNPAIKPAPRPIHTQAQYILQPKYQTQFLMYAIYSYVYINLSTCFPAMWPEAPCHSVTPSPYPQSLWVSMLTLPTGRLMQRSAIPCTYIG